MDNGLLNGIIFLDLKKAFDCVDHNILIKKWSYFGCKGTTLIGLDHNYLKWHKSRKMSSYFFNI